MKSKKVFDYFHKIYPEMTPRLATAKGMGLTSQAIYRWGAEVPKRTQILVELITDGEIKRDKAARK